MGTGRRPSPRSSASPRRRIVPAGMLSRHSRERLSSPCPAALPGQRRRTRNRSSVPAEGHPPSPLAPNDGAIPGFSLEGATGGDKRASHDERSEFISLPATFLAGRSRNLPRRERRGCRSREREEPTVRELWFSAWDRRGGSSCTPQPPSPGRAAGSEACCAAKAASPECGWSVAGKRIEMTAASPPLRRAGPLQRPLFHPKRGSSTAGRVGKPSPYLVKDLLQMRGAHPVGHVPVGRVRKEEFPLGCQRCPDVLLTVDVLLASVNDADVACKRTRRLWLRDRPSQKASELPSDGF